MSTQKGPITRDCICDPEKGTTCGWHADHPVTESVGTIEVRLRDSEARYEQAVAAIDKCQDDLRSWARARNQAEDRVRELRNDLRIARHDG